jgi:hypothetical protein
MTTSQRALVVALAVRGWMGTGHAQPMIVPPAPDVLLVTRFRTPLTYEAALARLESYYDEEIGRKLAVAFPEIAPHQHFELWHDMWVTFEPAEGGTNVTIKRPTDGAGQLLVKRWMLGVAGRIESPLPIAFKEEAPLRWTEAEMYGSAKDLARVFAEDGLKRLPTWEHAGLFVSAAPMRSVVLGPAGWHGVRSLKVTAESTAAAKQLANRVLQGVTKAGIYAAYSEASEVDEEIRSDASGKANTMGVTRAEALYVPMIDPKLIEEKLRTDPEIQKRVAAAQGQYCVRFRVDKAYRKVVVSWAGLTGYTRADGKYEGERPLGQDGMAAPRTGVALTARTKMESLRPGAYRIALRGETAGGEAAKIDERIYWFDGKSFEEL